MCLILKQQKNEILEFFFWHLSDFSVSLAFSYLEVKNLKSVMLPDSLIFSCSCTAVCIDIEINITSNFISESLGDEAFLEESIPAPLREEKIK